MEEYRQLYIWVEGEDDRRFFGEVVKPLLKTRYDSISIQLYASEKPTKVDDFLRSIHSMPTADYIFVSDIDTAPCITHKKATLQARYSHLDADRIIVVKAEIESWYAAGLDANACSDLTIRLPADTTAITKERFEQLIPAKFTSRLDFMIEVLNSHNIATARAQNPSFAYFATKHGL